MVINEVFGFVVATEILNENDDHEPRSVDECHSKHDWSKWKEAIQVELDSLAKCQVFGLVVPTPNDVKPVGYKWVFVRKHDDKNEISRYKARLMAQGFSQRPGIDYDKTYSLVMDIITFGYLISLSVSKGLDMHAMDIVTAYLYGMLENDIYMKVLEGLHFAQLNTSQPRNMYSIKLRRSLYGLKQYGRMWYYRLSEYLIKDGYINNPICPCVFIKKSELGFSILAVYGNDINLFGTPEELTKAATYLKVEFEMKDLGKTKYCLGLQIEHMSNGILIHLSTYVEKVLKQFNMDKADPLSSPMIVRSLDAKKDPFRPKEENEALLGPEVPYLSAIGALLYLEQCTRPNIAFSVNLLARFSFAPTLRHWNDVKHILRYLRKTTDLGLFYSKESTLKGYTYSRYLFYPHKAHSQTGYAFTCGKIAISWRSTKQTLTATSSNHSEIIALHEASRECVWLRSAVHHIRNVCGLPLIKSIPITIDEDNTACIEQIKEGYIQGDRTKHISTKFFFTHKL